MKKFIVKTTILVLAICIILSVLGMMLDAGLKKSKDYEYSEIYNGGIDADLLICGSSRAKVHISPTIIDSVLNTNSYNLGLNGQPYLMQIAKYNFYREYNEKPKYIIYAVDNMSPNKREELFDIDLYMPFLNDKALTATLQSHEGYHFIDYYNPFTKYAFKRDYIKRGIYQFFDIKYANPYFQKVKGYEGRDWEWDEKFDKFKEQNPNGVKQPYNKEVFEAFEQFVKTRREEDVKIVFVWTPQYSEYTKMVLNKEEALDFYTNLSAKYNIPFLDYSTDTICDNKSYFYNSQHMNKTGAELFSRKLANDLKEIGFVEE